MPPLTFFSGLRSRLLNLRVKIVDLGAYREVLQGDDLYRRYKRFIMLNASIRGPFVPFWSRNCWSDVYTSRVNDRTKVGRRPRRLNAQGS